jgi:acyl-CoA thioester hydrolase
MNDGPLSVTVSMPLRWADTDALGHVYHGTQISLIEEARTLWLNRATGHSAIWPHVVVRVAIDYRSPLSLADGPAEVTCVGSHVGRSSVGTRETVVSSTGVLIAEAASVVVAWDEVAERSRPLSEAEVESLREAIGVPEPA